MDVSEPGELYRQLLSKKEALEVEIRQRLVTTPNQFLGSKLAISLTSTRGAVRLALASGPGLVVIIFFPFFSLFINRFDGFRYQLALIPS